MNGRVLTSPPIAIDFWRIQSCFGVKMFFLSHLHSDHTSGLTASWSRPIFCSTITKKLLVHTFKIAEYLVHDLELNQPYNIQIRSDTGENMKVTLIDANHCPGAVMFHFEGSFGQILYTGDFRYKESISHQLMDVIPHLSIDHLFLDNTFCTPVKNIPPREEAVEEVISIIEGHPTHKILLALYTIGKEYLLEEISSRLKTKLCVSLNRLEILKILECSGNYVTNKNEARIHVINRWTLRKQFDASDDPVIAIIPSGFVRPNDLKDTRIRCVPLSDHSSFRELETFVKFIRPCKITCIVKNGHSEESGFERYLRHNHTLHPTVMANKTRIITSVPRYYASNKNQSKKRKLPERHGIKYSSDVCSSSEEFQLKCKDASENSLGVDKERSQNDSCRPTAAVNYLSSIERLNKKKKEKSITCSMCNDRFLASELQYNRNKGEVYGLGLCSRCDVSISQSAEKAQQMKTSSPVQSQ